MDTEITLPTKLEMDQLPSKIMNNNRLGQRLKTTREALSLTEKDVATRLFLNVRIISIMENNDYTNAPPATFMRGYLRAYCKLLNIPETEITATLLELDTLFPAKNTIIPLLSTESMQTSDRYLRWFTYLIILILVVLMGTWLSSHSHNSDIIVDNDTPKTLSATNTIPVEPTHSAASAPSQIHSSASAYNQATADDNNKTTLPPTPASVPLANPSIQINTPSATPTMTPVDPKALAAVNARTEDLPKPASKPQIHTASPPPPLDVLLPEPGA